MGYANANIAYLRYGSKLDDRALRLLLWMALVSLDPPGNPMFGKDPCRYWQGWEAQAEALGYVVPTDGEKRRSVYRQLQKVRARLVAAGAIVNLGTQDHGVTEWELRLEL